MCELCHHCYIVLRQLMDLVSKIVIRNHCYICEKVLRQLMDLVSKIVIRNHCYIFEKVFRQLTDLVSKIIIKNQCYIQCVDRVAFKRDQIPIYYTNVKSPQVLKRGECIQHGDRALATVKILKNSVFLYTAMRSQKSTINYSVTLLIYIIRNQYYITEILKLVGKKLV